MPPLESRPSIHSWWSDSNPNLRGPTLNLHAAAKPLSRFLYHRQALDIIKKNRGSPLSVATLEILSSYFPWDFVSVSTKTAIMSELANRSTSEVEARAVVDSPVFPPVAQMIGSPNHGVRISYCRLLGSLLRFEPIAPTMFRLKPYEQLVFLLSDKNLQVIREAASVLCELSKSVDNAQAIVDANATDHIFMLLGESTQLQLAYTLPRTCQLVARLASHHSTAPATQKLFVRMVSLLECVGVSGEYCFVIERPAYVLSTMAEWEDCAQAIVNAKATEHILTLLDSPSWQVRKWACQLVGRLASHQSTAPAISKLNPCARIVALLSRDYSRVIEQAVYALSEIAKSRDGAHAIVKAKATDHISILLDSPSWQVAKWQVRKWTCRLVGRLASHELISPIIFALKLSQQLVFLLGNDEIRHDALIALETISKWPDGVAALVVEGDVVRERLKKLSHDRSLGLKGRVRTRKIRHNIAQHMERDKR
ncbi:armadillo-type protein [Mycena galopus ATCC 62051]|nr:armadillo-type protein [Mycena galopus ATCC 62051]